MLYIGSLFDDAPDHWELRGDRLLWEEFGRSLAETEAPDDIRELERILETAFWETTGHSLSFSSQILVARFAEQGRTRGGISGADWRYRLFPLVIRRYESSLQKMAS